MTVDQWKASDITKLNEQWNVNSVPYVCIWREGCLPQSQEPGTDTCAQTPGLIRTAWFSLLHALWDQYVPLRSFLWCMFSACDFDYLFLLAKNMHFPEFMSLSSPMLCDWRRLVKNWHPVLAADCFWLRTSWVRLYSNGDAVQEDW